MNRERREFQAGERDYKRVPGGLLVQDRDRDVEERRSDDRRRRIADRGAVGQPALRVADLQARVWSNAIVVTKDLQTLGIGAGQQSRVDAVRIALEKAQNFGHDLDRSALASDAFFPFPDGPELAPARRVGAIIEPGGSSGTPR